MVEINSIFSYSLYMEKSGNKREIVVIESPFAGDIAKNREYLRLALRDSILNHNEAPIASHEFYTRALDADNDLERKAGIETGFALGKMATKTVIYEDLGISSGMKLGIKDAEESNRTIEYRKIDQDTLDEFGILDNNTENKTTELRPLEAKGYPTSKLKQIAKNKSIDEETRKRAEYELKIRNEI